MMIAILAKEMQADAEAIGLISDQAWKSLKEESSLKELLIKIITESYLKINSEKI